MSWSVNGITWTPQSAATHAQTNLTYLNNLNVAPTLVASPTNAIWLNYLGVGGLQQAYDAKLYAASQSFNVVTCDDSQVLNLAPITGTGPIPATYSTVLLSVTAGSGGTATIPNSTLSPFNGINFVVSGPVTVPANSTVNGIFAVADTAGPYLALAGQVTSFSTSIPNVATVTNPANSTQGNSRETTTAFRQRLVSGNGIIGWGLTGTTIAIKALQGITNAMVYFNVDTINNLTLTGGYIIGPRHAAILIQGADVTGQLANTYMARMTPPTAGANPENWTSASGQIIPVYYDTASNQSVYVKIYYDPNQPHSSGWLTIAQNLILGLNSTVAIGQEISQQTISQVLTGFTYATITGVTVSLDNVTFTRSVLINGNGAANFSATNITSVSGP